MAADHAAQPPDRAQPNDERQEKPAQTPHSGRDSGGPGSEDDPEALDLTYIRARRARAHDPRRSVNAANAVFAGRNEPPGPVALRRVVPPPAPPPASRSQLFGRSRTFWLLSVALFAIVAGVTFAFFYSRQTWAERAGVAPEVIHASVPVSSLQMHVAVQGERVLVSWDPRASGVRAAIGGLLTIDDTGQRHQFPLDATQAANGSVLYRPASGNVIFRLEIRNASGAVFDDSLRVVDPAKAALLAQKKAAPQDTARRVTPPIVPKTQARSAAVPARKPSVNRVAGAVAPRRSPTPDLRRIHRVQEAADRKIAPSAVSGGAHAVADTPVSMPAAAPAVLLPAQAVASSGAVLDAEIVRRALASETPAPTPASAAGGTAGELVGTVSAGQERKSANSLAFAGTFLPPQPVTQVMPKLRDSLAGAIAPGTKVEVQVRIDKHGRVKRAQIASASRNIDIGVQKAALDAARQWRFTPAWRNGKRVASEHTIVFHF